MVTTSEAAQKIIKRSRYLQEALEKGIINISALARYIKPELDEMLIKKTSESAIIMAINRTIKAPKPSFKYRNIFKDSPNMLMQSNLIEINIKKSKNSTSDYSNLFRLSKARTECFLTITEGVFETTIIASKDLYEDIKKILKNEAAISEFQNLCSITIRLPKEAVFTPGVFYFFLKSLAWEGINIIEIVSAYREFTFILERKYANKAFPILQSLFFQRI